MEKHTYTPKQTNSSNCYVLRAILIYTVKKQHLKNVIAFFLNSYHFLKAQGGHMSERPRLGMGSMGVQDVLCQLSRAHEKQCGTRRVPGGNGYVHNVLYGSCRAHWEYCGSRRINWGFRGVCV